MHVRTPAHLWSRVGVAAALVLAATSAGVGSAAADGDAPAGNNGTIKIDEYDMDDGNANDPHVACGFSVSFFGYDAGEQTATIHLDPSAPTDGGEPLTIKTGWSVDERTGGNQLDKNVQIAPAQVADMVEGIEPHPQQGYHVSVTVHVSGSQGADTKHKRFWIEPCATPEAAPEDVQTPQAAADEAAAAGFANGDTQDEAHVAAAAAAVGAGASAEDSELHAAAAVLSAGYIAPAAPAVALSLAGSTTG